MARTTNGRVDRLEDALSTLIQNQASFLARMVKSDRISSERFARIESILLDHSHILAEHSRLLHALPEAVRDKIGFKPPQQSVQ